MDYEVGIPQASRKETNSLKESEKEVWSTGNSRNAEIQEKASSLPRPYNQETSEGRPQEHHDRCVTSESRARLSNGNLAVSPLGTTHYACF